MAGIGLKNFVFYSIVPALLTGVLALAPVVYEDFNKPKSSLKYSYSTGPVMRLSDGSRQIFSTFVWNDGGTPLKNIRVMFTPVMGAVMEASGVEQVTGIKHKLIEEPGTTTYEVDNLLPGESFSVSVMLAAEGALGFNSIKVRSDEVLGVSVDGQVAEKNSFSGFLGAVLAAFAVFVMSLSGVGRFFGLDKKQDLLFFIFARAGLSSLIAGNKFEVGNFTYLRAADILLAYGVEFGGYESRRVVSALKCFLLVKDVASSSLQVIRSNLKILDEEFSDEEYELIRDRAVSLSDQALLRANINDYLRSSPSFLSSLESSKCGGSELA